MKNFLSHVRIRSLISKKGNRSSFFAPSRGFSIVELIVAVSIFVILSTTLIFNYNTYGGKVELSNAASQLALDIRETQSFAMGVRMTQGGQYPSYGIRFDRSSPYQYVEYADLNQNGSYDSGGTCGTANSECVRVVTFPQKMRIFSLCGMTSPTTSSSDCPGPLSTSQYFDVLFIRPNPNAVITGAPSGSALTYQTGEITVSTAKGYKKKVTIASTGQVTVN